MNSVVITVTYAVIFHPKIQSSMTIFHKLLTIEGQILANG